MTIALQARCAAKNLMCQPSHEGRLSRPERGALARPCGAALYTAYVTSIRCVVPEYKVNLDKLIRLLIEEKRANPSNYALVVLSEGC